MQGYSVKLFKRINALPGSNFSYILWGYFDGMEFEKRDTIEDFYFLSAKREIRTLPKLEGGRTRFEEQYIYLASSAPCDDLYLLNEDKTLPDNEIYPLIIVTELKLSEDLLLSEDEESRAVGLLERELEAYDGPPLRYHLFRSLGYSDYVLIFRTRKYEPAVKLINRLRQLRISREKSDLQILKSTYSIAGCERRYLNDIDRLADGGEVLRASIKVALRPGAKMSKISKNIEEQTRIYSQRWNSTTLGKFDQVIEVEDTVQNIAALFNTPSNTPPKDRLLNIGNRSMQIVQTATEWLFHNDKVNEENNYSRNASPQHALLVQKQLGILDSEFGKVSKLVPEPLAIALWRLMFEYYYVSQTVFAENHLLFELYPAIRSLLSMIGEGYSSRIDSEELDASLEIGINSIVELIQNRIQASRLIFESPALNLNFSGSTTKISVMYMAILQSISKKHWNLVEKSKPKGDHPKIAFFTLTNFLNRIKSDPLFANSRIRQRLLVPITLGNDSFFNLLVSIPLVVHEMAHYLRPFDRSRRNRIFGQIVCNRIALSLLNHLLSDEYEKFTRRWQEASRENAQPIANHFAEKLFDRAVENLAASMPGEQFNAPLKQFAEQFGKAIMAQIDLTDSALLKQTRRRFSKVPSSPAVSELADIIETYNAGLYLGNDVGYLAALWQERMDNIGSGDLPKAARGGLQRAWDDMVDALGERREQLRKFWEDVIGNSGLHKFADEVISGGDYSVEERFFLARILAKSRLNEVTPSNSYELVNQIFGFLTARRSTIYREIVELVELVEEMKADHIMVRILGLSEKQYSDIVDHVQKTQRPGADWDLDAQDEQREAIELRRFYLKRQGLFSDAESRPNDSVDSGVSSLVGWIVDLVAATPEDGEGLFSDIEALCQTLSDDDWVQQLKKDYQSLYEAREGGSEEVLAVDFNFVVKYWRHGLANSYEEWKT